MCVCVCVCVWLQRIDSANKRNTLMDVILPIQINYNALITYLHPTNRETAITMPIHQTRRLCRPYDISAHLPAEVEAFARAELQRAVLCASQMLHALVQAGGTQDCVAGLRTCACTRLTPYSSRYVSGFACTRAHSVSFISTQWSVYTYHDVRCIFITMAGVQSCIIADLRDGVECATERFRNSSSNASGQSGQYPGPRAGPTPFPRAPRSRQRSADDARGGANHPDTDAAKAAPQPMPCDDERGQRWALGTNAIW